MNEGGMSENQHNESYEEYAHAYTTRITTIKTITIQQPYL
jgi:hypothetical protein